MAVRLQDLTIGALAGAAATVPMSAVMLASQGAGVMDEQPPERITEEVLDRADIHPSKPVTKQLTVLSHLGFGAAAGGLYAMLRRGQPPLSTEIPVAIGYGLGVWFVSYEGWVPALGFMPPSHKAGVGRPVTMATAHVVFGACLALATRGITRGAFREGRSSKRRARTRRRTG